MSIIERARSGPLVDLPSELVKSLVYLAELENRCMKTWEDSNGEIVDSRIAQWIKLKLDVIKSLHSMDPNTRREEVRIEKEAELALACAKQMLTLNPRERAELARTAKNVVDMG